MLVYNSFKSVFLKDVDLGNIDQIILKAFEKKLHRRTSEKEIESWSSSLLYMARVISDPEIPDNVGVSIECQIPQTSKRIDFILSGSDTFHHEHVVIIELKQWKTSELSEKDGIIKTALGRGLHETNHPSYQAYSYSLLLEDFCETVTTDVITLKSCAYLHNYELDDVIRNPFYDYYTEKAPVFLKREIEQLRSFIKQYVHHGDDGAIMYRIDSGRIRPSKQLCDSLVKMIAGNREFILLDEQKLVYETALYLAREEAGIRKKVFIVEGGPGTGKSVVAINLLVELTRRGLLAQYVTKNAAPRAVYMSKLTASSMTKTRFYALFQGSGQYVDCATDTFDALVVDEAHRLNEKSGLYQNQGINQVKEIIDASRLSIFFIDEDQRVTLKDIGTKEEIRSWANLAGAEIHEMKLESQFRCNGSEGYLSFLDNILQIRETANSKIEDIDYDFQIIDSPILLREIIKEKNKEKNSARLVAGYCWDWKSKNNPRAFDITFPGTDFEMKWNLSTDGSLWIIQPNSINEIGCIHTCQGLELDYIGVIVGPDLIVRNGIVMVDPSKRSHMDRSIHGYNSLLQNNVEEAREKIRLIIKNTYRTLFTRGMKGCYVYFTDKETAEYFRERMEH
ncbi:MAG TPA: DUF2075 domain-containing protein [Bacteroidales bacterium]|nr:DUF2075 domain-containing protein [Bacteroidales bacterium]